MNDNRRWHIRIVSVSSGEVKQLTKGIYHEHSIAWSPRGDEIAVRVEPRSRIPMRCTTTTSLR